MKMFLSLALTICIITCIIFQSTGLQAQSSKGGSTLVSPTTSHDLTAKDFKDLIIGKGDNRVVNYRVGNIQYTMIPLRDLWLTPKRKEAFEVTLKFIENLSAVWLANGYGINLDQQIGYMEHELQNKTAEQIRELAKQNNVRPGMPTDAEIMALTRDARLILKKKNDRTKFMVEYDDMMGAFESAESLITDVEANAGLEGFKQLVPTALMGVIGVKLPETLTAAMNGNRFLKPFAFLSNGSLTVTPIVRPWYVISTNLDSGEVKAEGYSFETTLQAWYAKDFKSGKFLTNGGFKLGLGAIFGDYEKVEDIHGMTVGYDRNFSYKKTIVDFDLSRLLKNTIRVGAFTAVDNTLKGFSFDSFFDSFLENGFLMLTRQVNGETFTESQGNFELGYSHNLVEITKTIQSNFPTIDELAKEAAALTPGASVIFVNGQTRIKVPTAAVAPETPARPADLQSPVDAQTVPEKTPNETDKPSLE